MGYYSLFIYYGLLFIYYGLYSRRDDGDVMKKLVWILLLCSCGQQTVDLNELETFFRGREVLFNNSLSNDCQYTLEKTDIGLDVKHKTQSYVEHYSFSDFEITEKYAFGIESKYFEIGRFRIIGQANQTIMLLYSQDCIEKFY